MSISKRQPDTALAAVRQACIDLDLLRSRLEVVEQSKGRGPLPPAWRAAMASLKASWFVMDSLAIAMEAEKRRGSS